METRQVKNKDRGCGMSKSKFKNVKELLVVKLKLKIA